jgi:ketosteroid isomerase-like protein
MRFFAWLALAQGTLGGLKAICRELVTESDTWYPRGVIVMSRQKDLLREIAAAHNSGAPDRISDWFTEDFRLHEPGASPLPVGHEGARQMRARFRALTPPINLETLDMIEEDDRVAVRWQLTATYAGRPFEQSVMAIYRFEKGRIAEDWGVSIPALWP